MQTLKKILGKKEWVIGGAVLIIALIAVISTSFSPSKVHADASPLIQGDIHGYAWSSTIGWVSLNCAEGSPTGGDVCATSNYKVSVAPDPSRAYSGYGWSDKIGWVSFNASDAIAHCGVAPMMTDDGHSNGFAWVVSGTNASGADGCISLHYVYPSPYYYDVYANPTTGNFSGFAWGDVNVGWLNFNLATFAYVSSAPSVDLKGDVGAGPVDGPVTLTILDPSAPGGGVWSIPLSWTEHNVSSCVASSDFGSTDWDATTDVTAAASPHFVSVPATVPGTFTFKISCHPTDITLPDVHDSFIVTISSDLPATISVDLKINTLAGPSDGPITMPSSAGGMKTLSYTTTGAVASCAAQPLTPTPPTSTDWGTTTTTFVGSDDTMIPSNTTSLPVTYTYKITCIPMSGGPTVSDSVLVTVPPPGAPWCELSPSSGSITFGAPGTAVLEDAPINVVWHDGPFVPTTVSLDTTAAPAFTGTLTPSLVPDALTAAMLHLTGTMPPLPAQTVTLTATASDGTVCTPTTLTLVPGGTGTISHPRPPWIEF